MKNRKLFLMTTLVIVIAVVLAACQPAPASAPAPVKVIETVVVEKQVEVEKVVEKTVVVEVEKTVEDPGLALKGKKIAGLLSGPVNDGGWNTNAYKALVNLRDKYGMEIAYTEHTKVEDAAQVMRDYADSGFDYVLAHGYEYADQVKEVAAEYPDLKFIHTNGTEKGVPNLYTVTFAAGEGGYIIGYTAGLTTKVNKVHWVVGTEFPLMTYELEQSAAGCKASNPSCEVTWSFVGSWGDPTKTKELAKAALDSGNDVIIGCADAGDLGAVEAVKEAATGDKYLRYISWVADQIGRAHV
jgi:basic membrane protein A